MEFAFSGRSKTFARKDGKELSFKVPFGIQLEKYFVMDEREYPLLLGVPSVNSSKLLFRLPPNAKLKKAPSDYHLDTDCIEYRRTVKRERASVMVEQRLTFKCERITAQQYLEYRDQIQEFRRRLEEDVVIKTR